MRLFHITSNRNSKAILKDGFLHSRKFGGIIFRHYHSSNVPKS
jgi:hypothetical protein